MDNVAIFYLNGQEMIRITEPGGHDFKCVEMTVDEAKQLAGELAGRLAGVLNVHEIVVRGEL